MKRKTGRGGDKETRRGGDRASLQHSNTPSLHHSITPLPCPILIITLMALTSCTIKQPIPARGLPDFKNTSSYCVYYGNWTPELVSQAATFDLVILHPKSNLTRAMVKKMQAGGALVVGYLSVGEDDTLHTSEATGGVSGADGKHANWYYYKDGKPVKNGEWGSYFTRASNAHWRKALKTYRNEGKQGWYGYDYILNDLGCDGLFLDTLDTHAPKEWGMYGDIEGMANLIAEIKTNIGRKHLVLNRGLYFWESYYTSDEIMARVRSSASAVMFENYIEEDDLAEWEGRLRAQYQKPDGFSVITLDYKTAKTDEICARAIKKQGWSAYIADVQLSDKIRMEAREWVKRVKPEEVSNP